MEVDNSLIAIAEQSKSVTDLKFGKSIHNANYDIFQTGTIGSIERIVSAMPAPKAKKGKKKKKVAEEEPTEPGSPEGGKAKKKKKKKAKKSNLPEVPPLKYGPPQSCEQALANTLSWKQNNIISQKLSVGVLTTANHEIKAKTFDTMNPIGNRAPI